MSNLLIHAEKELERIGMGRHTKDPQNKLMHDQIIEIVKTFSKQGHSGFSASYALSIIPKLLNFEPIKPLTGEDDEWAEPHEGWGPHEIQQNKRYSSVFRDRSTGEAWDINAVSFRRGKNGLTSRWISPLHQISVHPKEQS